MDRKEPPDKSFKEGMASLYRLKTKHNKIYQLTSMMMRPTFSPSAVISKKTRGRAMFFLSVGFEEVAK